MGDEDPKYFFARISRLETTMRAVGFKKSDSDIVQIILLQLPERYDVVKMMTLAGLQLTRQRLENIIRSAYSETMAGDVCVGGTPVPPCSCRRPWFSGRGGRGRRWHASAAAAATATLVSRRWHASAAAAAAATLASRRWHSAAAAATATLASRRWHAAAAAATAAIVSRR